MTRSEADPSPVWDMVVAYALLTRLPLPRAPDAAFARQARAAWAFPLVGLGLGAAGAAVMALGPTPALGAGLALGLMALLSGALHEDGLADTADGLWGGATRARRLEIMKDSRIGAYGVLALIFVTGLRWSALAALGPLALIAAATLSRGMLPVLMAWLPPARADGLSRHVGAPGAAPALIALAIGAAVAVALLGGPAFAAVAAGAAACAVLAAVAVRKIGGQTGDILGAAQQISEAAILIALAAQL